MTLFVASPDQAGGGGPHDLHRMDPALLAVGAALAVLLTGLVLGPLVIAGFALLCGLRKTALVYAALAPLLAATAGLLAYQLYAGLGV